MHLSTIAITLLPFTSLVLAAPIVNPQLEPRQKANLNEEQTKTVNQGRDDVLAGLAKAAVTLDDGINFLRGILDDELRQQSVQGKKIAADPAPFKILPFQPGRPSIKAPFLNQAQTGPLTPIIEGLEDARANVTRAADAANKITESINRGDVVSEIDQLEAAIGVLGAQVIIDELKDELFKGDDGQDRDFFGSRFDNTDPLKKFQSPPFNPGVRPNIKVRPNFGANDAPAPGQLQPTPGVFRPSFVPDELSVKEGAANDEEERRGPSPREALGLSRSEWKTASKVVKKISKNLNRARKGEEAILKVQGKNFQQLFEQHGKELPEEEIRF